MIDFQVRRSDLHACRFVEGATPEPAPGQVLLRIDRFALTANNITYAVLGDAMSYWGFFPAPDGWGHIPVWGYAEVTASLHDGVAVGERLFGYLPMASHAVVTPGAVTATDFYDTAPHRPTAIPIYNRYARSPGDPQREPEQAVLRPLFMTSFLLADWLTDQSFFGAEAVVLISASSKTAIGTAKILSAEKQCRVVGLTSPARVDFLRSLGCYDHVYAYDQIGELPRVRTVLVDLAADAAIKRAVHVHLGDQLAYSCSVGSTHARSVGGAQTDLPGPAPTMWLAAAQIAKRNKDWGPAGFQERMGAAWREISASLAGRIRVVESRGPEAVERIYREVLDGQSRTDEAHVLSL